MCDDDLKSCPMNQSPSDILEASNETVSISIATADRLCVASGTVRVRLTPLNRISSRGVDAPRQEFVVSLLYAMFYPRFYPCGFALAISYSL